MDKTVLYKKKKRLRIEVEGRIQGVGFRPTVYRYAVEKNLAGYVCNTTKGVLIEVEGDIESVNGFVDKLKNFPPPNAVIKEMFFIGLPLRNEKKFKIVESKIAGEKRVDVSPDIATCKECVTELFNSQDRRYKYPFINCTNCGPRFTIIKSLPYDRENTTMEEFEMCNLCKKEYENPGARRFHAQPNCCFECGPDVQLLNKDLKVIEKSVEGIKKTVGLLKEGEIVAIKGIGGFHLAGNAKDADVIRKLRERKRREEKPFALMAKDIEVIKKYCYILPEEEELIKSPQAPILLLKKKNSALPEEIAPKNRYLGFMLPYTPLHHLLFNLGEIEVLIMTSGNLYQEPIIFENSKAISKLRRIADYFLIHNRKIFIGCDDSVTRMYLLTKKEIVIRRARGYAPSPIEVNFEIKDPIISVGAHLKNTFAMGKENKVYLSQHIGDMENYESLRYFEKNLEHFKRIFNLAPAIVAYDLHPEYLTTKYAKEIIEKDNLKGVGIQHHHAHISSCMAENFIGNKKVIGVAFDGTGYGEDGNIWGGEFLICNYSQYERVAHFDYFPLPGGEKAIREVWRLGAAYLYKTYGDEFLRLDIDFTRRIGKEKLNTIKEMVKNKINCPLTSSAGRLFDAVSSLCGIRDYVSYEGQAAIELEMAIQKASLESFYEFEIEKEEEIYIIKVEKVIKGIVKDLKNSLSSGIISYKFHLTIVQIIKELSKILRDKKSINHVVLSGGVFQNIFLLEQIYKDLIKEDFKVYIHSKVPPNDGGISLGQVAIANFKIK